MLGLKIISLGVIIFKEKKMKTKIFYIGIALLILFIICLILFFIFSSKNRDGKPVLPTPIPVPTDFNYNYSKINLLVPGKSTFNDVVKTIGYPYSTSSLGSKSVLYYQTPSLDFKNMVVLEKGVVVYAIEYVFGNYRGNYNSYVYSYGQPNISRYDPKSYFNWYVFLKKGVAIESSNNEVTAVLYFIPQSEADFLSSVAKDLGLLKDSPEKQEQITQ